MKQYLVVMLALNIFMVTGAVAGNGHPIIAGLWEGSGHAIYMDGTQADISLVTANLTQEGMFVYGNTQFTVKIGENIPVTQSGQMSGYIQGNALKGTFGFCITVAPDCVGAAILEGKITGKSLSGTVVDLSDGSTGVITLKRVTD